MFIKNTYEAPLSSLRLTGQPGGRRFHRPPRRGRGRGRRPPHLRSHLRSQAEAGVRAHPGPKGLAQGNEHSGRCSLCPRVGMPLESSGTKQTASPSTPGEEPPREAGSSVPPPLTGEARAFAMLTGRKQVLLWTRLPGSRTHRENEHSATCASRQLPQAVAGGPLGFTHRT